MEGFLVKRKVASALGESFGWTINRPRMEGLESVVVAMAGTFARSVN